MEGAPTRKHPETGPESLEIEKVDSVVTAKGSTYRYLPDGRTQRFKQVEGKMYEPQSALVYVPDYEWVKQRAPREVLEQLGETEWEYEQTLLGYVQNPYGDNRKVYIVDKAGKIVETNEAIKNTEGQIFLNFLKDGKPQFTIPVSHKPVRGFSTFDTRRYVNEKTGESMRERHLGNKVTRIVEKEETSS